ncbi:L-serine ammonia-lyase [Cryptococcus gattii E566]|uniref:L-serine ammonia-lyase n=2 Tax=Cryptococcus gattii TaxID=37769 RepID=E6RE04_CRYGW|nr:L-serine ammonia-lyase, putative [Cryptococcus gattii WM276]ADV25040.1 L-serine ammonia-lyase, putative [Cryptococcus gattii WM276]KIR78991.1 L-serine ammonia-lyase [Cryptococcus gattii EJB2]KIY30848.1 L-serine ammonia-lyase [Cryptococcus gattii E566]KJE01729.1 L-serine ammonia-lyase [Cryptococcus gattii NT-10]
MTIATSELYNHKEIPQPWRETPLVPSPALSRLAGCRIFLKLDNLQPSGSFKSRGIGNLVRRSIQRAPPNAPLHFYSSSGGNAGLACVTAATSLGYPSTVVVPMTTTPMMISKLITAGASNVIQEGVSLYHADAYLKEQILPQDQWGVYIPPFDHEDIWQGAESVAEEVVNQMGGERPDAMVCSVGGGGLMIGICQGLEKVGGTKREEGGEGTHQTEVIAVETQGADSLNQAIKAQELITLPSITSIATSLGCARVASRALDIALGLSPALPQPISLPPSPMPSPSSSPTETSLPDSIATLDKARGPMKNSKVVPTLVTDKEAVQACIQFLDDERILVEPACGATLALVYTGRLKEVMKGRLTEDSKVVLVVCGGSNVSFDVLQRFKVEYGL